MKKKVVAMLLAGIMAAGVLAGCGGSSDSGQGGSGNKKKERLSTSIPGMMSSVPV